MSHASYAKIARQHSQPDPGDWVAPDLDPADWIARVIQPLLADLPAPLARIEPRDIRLDTQDPKHHYRDCAGLAGLPTRLVGEIRLTIESPDHGRYDRRYAHDAIWPEQLDFGLYWVGDERQIAIVPRLLRNRAYGYPTARADFAYPTGPEALRALVLDLLEQLRQQLFNKQKRTKVRGLQIQAIAARLKQIASEERFAFYVESTTQLIRIGIRLDDSMELRLSVPFSEFENALSELRGMVVNLRALYRRRIRLKTQQLSRYASWIQPDPPAESSIPSSDIPLSPASLPNPSPAGGEG